MTNVDFKGWRKRMGMSQVEAAEALGLSRETVVQYEAGRRRDTGAEVKIPRTVALACSALAHGLPPYR